MTIDVAIDVLEYEHQGLERLFIKHQEALIDSDFLGALAYLKEFVRKLRQHIKLEEDRLLPAYTALKGSPRGGDPEFFFSEHRKVRRMAGELLQSCRGFNARPCSTRGIVELIEREGRFKSLLKHHQEREEKILYPRVCGGRAS